MKAGLTLSLTNRITRTVSATFRDACAVVDVDAGTRGLCQATSGRGLHSNQMAAEEGKHEL